MTMQTHTLDAPGATITYDVRGDLSSGVPLLTVGSPMDASGFVSLTSHITDRPVVTYDPRGTARSPRTDGAPETQPEEHADDLARVIEALGGGPVDLFATSGGAVNGLALVERHPGLVRTFVAHEPPLAEFLPDRAEVLATANAIWQLYQDQGLGPAMAKFIEYTMIQGPIPPEYPAQPAPDPSAFGLPPEDDGTRGDPLVSQNIRTCGAYQPDLAVLRGTTTRIVVAVGEESGQSIAARGGLSLAAALGIAPTMFPSHHAGFVGDEYGPGMGGQPKEFADRLLAVLSGGS